MQFVYRYLRKRAVNPKKLGLWEKISFALVGKLAPLYLLKSKI
uniref:Uncharacterized protein n=1 Tax=Siphoviridae sp. ctuUw41 TaxID=2826503 RepID=A0A8S5MYI8_9CAUD|nr:MAG TPA: hypothetical protein [Siphoviridae sp. ctuUw41]